MINQRDIAKYVKQVGKRCPAPYRRKLMTELPDNLADFVNDNPEASMEDILKHFVSPEKFADECLLTMDETKRRNILHRAAWSGKVVCMGIAMAIAIVLGVIAIAAIRREDATDSVVHIDNMAAESSEHVIIIDDDTTSFESN